MLFVVWYFICCSVRGVFFIARQGSTKRQITLLVKTDDHAKQPQTDLSKNLDGRRHPVHLFDSILSGDPRTIARNSSHVLHPISTRTLRAPRPLDAPHYTAAPTTSRCLGSIRNDQYLRHNLFIIARIIPVHPS